MCLVFTVQCHASAVLAVIVCMTVCQSVHQSVCQCWYWYWFITAKCRIMETTPHDSTGIFDAKDLHIIRTRSPQWGCQMQVG